MYASVRPRQYDQRFFCLGTPSLAPSYLVSRILDAIEKSASVADSAEITLEVNPTSFETDQLR